MASFRRKNVATVLAAQPMEEYRTAKEVSWSVGWLFRPQWFRLRSDQDDPVNKVAIS